MRARRALTPVLLLLLCRAVFAAEVSPQQIDDLFVALTSKEAPGAAVLVVKDGRTLFERGYGIADLQNGAPVNAQTNFRLASVTKQFTATAIMLLVRDGKLRYDTCLTDIFPSFPEYSSAITIRNLLNHTSGLLDYENLMPKHKAQNPAEPIPQIQDKEVLQLLSRQNTTKFMPGSRWDYSNSGYVVLGQVVEKITAKPFGDFLRERIFLPLGMRGTIAYQKGRNEVPNRAFGHTRHNGVWQQTDQSPTSATLGDGGVYSSITDMAKWDRALREHTLLTKSEIGAAVTPAAMPNGSAVEPNGSPAEYGFGWFLNPFKGHRRMWHYGETIGFRTTIQRFTNDSLSIIILCNRSDLDPTALALKIADLEFRP